MKNTWIKAALLFPTLAGFHSFAQANVLITEYVEGSGNNKAIEISNLGAAAVDLTGYQLIKYGNGNIDSTVSYDYSGTLAAGASIVIYNSSADDTFKTTMLTSAPGALSETSIVQHNGDDPFTLNKDGAVVDSIGVTGDISFGTNVTLRRNANISTGDTDVTDAWSADTEWTSLASNTADGLGCSGVDACSAAPAEPDPDPESPSTPTGSVVIISEIVNGSGSNKVIEISNIGDTDIDLADNRFKLQLFRDGSTWPNEQVFLQGNLIAGSSLVVYDADAGANFQKAAPQGLDATDVATFTGNDAIVLMSGTGETVVDSFGQVGSNQVWISATDTLRRKSTVVSGNTNMSDTFSTAQMDEWSATLQDTFDGLGCKGESACVGDEPVPTAGTALVVTQCLNCPDISKVFDIATYNHDAYYSTTLAAGTADKTAFRAALTQDISANYTQLSYSEVWTALTYTDEDPTDSDNVILLYSGRSIFKQQNASGDQSSNQDYWNREHVWAKSHGFPSESQKGYTDIHHLRPADVSLNSARGNLDFANGGDQVEDSDNKRVNGDSWEPRDEVKGDVARMVLYMDVRYENNEADMPDLVLIDAIKQDAYEDSSSPVANLGKLCDLLTWHAADPVDDFERTRNDRIHEYQGNRNPFIDHPEWVSIAFRDACITEVDPIGFATQNDVAISTIINSESQTLTGFDAPLSINVSNGEYSVGCTDTYATDTGTVNSGDTICLRHTSSTEYSTEVTTSVTIGETTFNFRSVTMADPTPVEETPSEETPTEETPSEETPSEETPSEETPTEETPSEETPSEETPSEETPTEETPTEETPFEETPAEETPTEENNVPVNEFPTNETPVRFALTDVLNTDLATAIISGNVVVSGLGANISAPISVSEGGEYSLGCNGKFTAEAGTVKNGDYFCVRHTASSEYATETKTTVSINGVSADFVSTTMSQSFEAEQIKARTADEEEKEDDITEIGSFGLWMLLLPGLLIIRRRKTNI